MNTVAFLARIAVGLVLGALIGFATDCSLQEIAGSAAIGAIVAYFILAE